MIKRYSAGRKVLGAVLGIAVATAASAETPEEMYPDYNTNSIAPDMTKMNVTATEIAKHIQLGFNIGNTLEAPGGETGWGNPMIDKYFIKLIKKSGFDAVRLPVAWNLHADPETAKIDEDWMNRVKEVVQMCMDNDLITIINIHWDGGWLEKNVTPDKQDEVNARQKALWQQIATQMRDFDGRLLFAGANEPDAEDETQMKVLLSYHQTFVDTVRATGGKNAYRTLIVQGPTTDIQKTADLMQELPKDTIADRMMVEVHFYSPYQFTLMNEDQDWGTRIYYWGKKNFSKTDKEHNADPNNEDEFKALFELMKHKFADNGIPVVLGEYSAMNRRELSGKELELNLKSRDYWHEFITKEALANGMIPFCWDVGGVLDRKDIRVSDERTLKALKQGAGK